jgi:nucleotide-binding universal stress UspA family protein
VNIKAMLMRLESALDRTDLADTLILLPGSKSTSQTVLSWPQAAAYPESESFSATCTYLDADLSDIYPMESPDLSETGSEDGQPSINFVVGYNSSPNSHAALDLTLWMAHQTRLVTRQPVVVQVVYVLQPEQLNPAGSAPKTISFSNRPGHRDYLSPEVEGLSWGQVQHPPEHAPACALMPQPVWDTHQREHQPAGFRSTFNLGPVGESLGFADRVLWQARCLANEWRGSVKTHLRFGDLAQELHQVVCAEAASLLILGCHSANHPLIQKWDKHFPCPVIGIPQPEAQVDGTI